jgi:hypothetical protein
MAGFLRLLRNRGSADGSKKRGPLKNGRFGSPVGEAAQVVD